MVKGRDLKAKLRGRDIYTLIARTLHIDHGKLVDVNYALWRIWLRMRDREGGGHSCHAPERAGKGRTSLSHALAAPA